MKTHQHKRTILHVSDKIPGTDGAIVFGDYFQLTDVVDLIGRDHHRSEAEERVDALGSRKVPRVLAQNIECRKIQRSRVPEDRLPGLFGIVY